VNSVPAFFRGPQLRVTPVIRKRRIKKRSVQRSMLIFGQ